MRSGAKWDMSAERRGRGSGMLVVGLRLGLVDVMSGRL